LILCINPFDDRGDDDNEIAHKEHKPKTSSKNTGQCGWTQLGDEDLPDGVYPCDEFNKTHTEHGKVFIVLETCFSFLIHCWPIRARECDMK